METSYDFNHLKRDLAETFETVSKGRHNLLSIIPIRGESRNYKHEWLEDVIEATIDALDGAILFDDLTIDVDNGAKFAVGDIIAFEGYDEVMRITGKDGDTLTVARGYGDTTPEGMDDDTVVRVISRPRAEASDPGYDAVSEPSAEFNFTQIFDRTAKISKSAVASEHLVIDDLVDFHVKHHLELLQIEMNAAMIYGRRYANTSDASIPRTMGGILYFLDQEDGNVIDAEAGAITAEDLNDLIEMIAEDGGRPDILVCNTAQARAITAFNALSGSTPIVRTSWSDERTGGAVYEFVGDLPLGMVERIIVDTAFPQDKIALLDSSKLALVPMKGRAFRDLPATPSEAADYIARRIIGEYTLEVRNALHAHGLVKNLATS
ncbi:MAG TPA: hypothetical protein ENN07_04685 [candidate division Zixibacteria bacterium]|nr:hypothetical protein [candidate division Zixibacteria bacterium]